MVVEPAVKVKAVIGAAATEANTGDTEFGQEAEADSQIGRRLPSRKAPYRGQRKQAVRFLAHNPALRVTVVGMGSSIGRVWARRRWLHRGAWGGETLRPVILLAGLLIAKLLDRSLQEWPPRSRRISDAFRQPDQTRSSS